MVVRFSVGNALDGDRFNETAAIHLVLTRPGGEWVLSCTGGKAVHDESLAEHQMITCPACYTEAVRLLQAEAAAEEDADATASTD